MMAVDIHRCHSRSGYEEELDKRVVDAINRIRDILRGKTSYHLPDMVGNWSETRSVQQPCHPTNVKVNGVKTESQYSQSDGPIDFGAKDKTSEAVKFPVAVDEPYCGLENRTTESTNERSSDARENSKKSNLDPNSSPYISSVNAYLPNSMACPRCGFLSSTLPYAFQDNQIPHLLQTSAESQLPPNNSQQTEGNTLPPAQQPTYTALNYEANTLLQHPQMSNQPLFVTNAHNSNPYSHFANPNSHRINDYLNFLANPAAYGYPEAVVPGEGFQSPEIGQLSRAGAPFPFMSPRNPELGTHFVPTGVPATATPPEVLLSRFAMTQTPYQHNYPPQGVPQMQPNLQLLNPSYQQVFQHGHPQPQSLRQVFPHSLNQRASLTLPPRTLNRMFAQQPLGSCPLQTPLGIGGHAYNSSMMAGLLPVENRCSVPQSVAGSQQTQVGSTLVGAHPQNPQVRGLFPTI